MSIIDNLITDRTQSDVDGLRELLARGKANWTSEELAEFNLARSKGSYNYTDLNRVTACMDYLDETLKDQGASQWRWPTAKRLYATCGKDGD